MFRCLSKASEIGILHMSGCGYWLILIKVEIYMVMSYSEFDLNWVNQNIAVHVNMLNELV